MTNDSKHNKPNIDVGNNKTQLTEDELTEKELGQVTGGDNKIVDKASTKLMQQLSSGTHFDTAII